MAHLPLKAASRLSQEIHFSLRPFPASIPLLAMFSLLPDRSGANVEESRRAAPASPLARLSPHQSGAPGSSQPGIALPRTRPGYTGSTSVHVCPAQERGQPSALSSQHLAAIPGAKNHMEDVNQHYTYVPTLPATGRPRYTVAYHG